jgi:hypothetical protein
MSNNNSAQFKFLYDSILKGIKVKTHSWINNYIINYMNKKVQGDGIEAGKDQEVIRKLNSNKIEEIKKQFF